MKLIDSGSLLQQSPELMNIYNFFMFRYPRNQTDRCSDLKRLLTLDNSFCMYSKHRNGATTLLRDFTTQKGGGFIDAMSLSHESLKESLARQVGEHHLVVIDEAGSLFDLFGGYDESISYLQEIASTRQIGLRLHPYLRTHQENVQERGFSVIEIEKIPYEELHDLVQKQFASVKFPLPEELIHQAHFYQALQYSLFYIGEGFRFLVEHPGEHLDHEALKSTTETEHPYQFRHK